MLNNVNINDIIKSQQTTTNTAYTNYDSKKSLLSANVLTQVQATAITQLKNCFSFCLHKDKQYLVITMYFNSTKKYEFWVLNLVTMCVSQFASVKLAKQFVTTQLQQTPQSATTTTTEADKTAETPQTNSSNNNDTIVNVTLSSKNRRNNSRNK